MVESPKGRGYIGDKNSYGDLGGAGQPTVEVLGRWVCEHRESRAVRLFGVPGQHLSMSPLPRPRELSTEIQPKQQPLDVPPNLPITFPSAPLDESMKPGNIDCAHIGENGLGSVSVRDKRLL